VDKRLLVTKNIIGMLFNQVSLKMYSPTPPLTRVNHHVLPAHDVGVALVELTEGRDLHLTVVVLEHVPHPDLQRLDVHLTHEPIHVLQPRQKFSIY